MQNYNSKFKILFLGLFLLILTAGCAPQVEEVQGIKTDDGETLVDIILPTKEAEPTKEAVFIYKDEGKELSVMTYGGGPKLTGILRSETPLAIIEIVDQGFVVGVGEKVCGYTVATIEGRNVILKKQRKTIKLKMKEGK